MQAVYELVRILNIYSDIGKPRLVLMAQVVLSFIKVRTVCPDELASGFAGSAKPASSERRIRRFLTYFPFNPDGVSRFVASKLPVGSWLISIDRTNWQFGIVNINILLLSVCYKGVAIPIVWKLLTRPDEPGCGKKGNSSTQERIELMERFIRIFGIGRIAGFLADRESVGSDWFVWLREHNVNIFIRIRENQQIGYANGSPVDGKKVFRHLKKGQSHTLGKARKIGGANVYPGALRLPDSELLIVATFHQCDHALEIYAERWQIETLFACPETRGFRFESTHLTDFEKISKLLGLITIAFVWCYLVGDELDEKEPRPIRKHGYRAKSVFRHGFDHIRRILTDMTDFQNELFDIMDILACNIFSNMSNLLKRYDFVR